MRRLVDYSKPAESTTRPEKTAGGAGEEVDQGLGGDATDTIGLTRANCLAIAAAAIFKS